MNTVKATGEYGLVVRQDALLAKNITLVQLMQAMEVDQAFDSNADLISFGPSFGEEAMNEFISRLRTLGLEYVDDFFSIALDLPSWCSLRVEINKSNRLSK